MIKNAVVTTLSYVESLSVPRVYQLIDVVSKLLANFLAVPG
tara:strand:- start:8994 stop:9116 length:123 start_codon:yes stop_codon:yes gene_type:complete